MFRPKGIFLSESQINFGYDNSRQSKLFLNEFVPKSESVLYVVMLIETSAVSSPSSMTETEFNTAYDNGEIYFSFQADQDVSSSFFVVDSKNFDRLFPVLSYIEKTPIIMHVGFAKEEKFNTKGYNLKDVRIYVPSWELEDNFTLYMRQSWAATSDLDVTVQNNGLFMGVSGMVTLYSYYLRPNSNRNNNIVLLQTTSVQLKEKGLMNRNHFNALVKLTIDAFYRDKSKSWDTYKTSPY